MAKIVVGLFDTTHEAQEAVQDLRDAGFRSEDISFLARDVEREGARSAADTGTEAEEGAAVGATGGAVLGGLGGLLVGIGALAIPGIGPIVGGGVLLSTLAGAGVGAAAGGLVGALVGAGIPEEEAHVYAESVRRGSALVTVHTDTDDAAYRAADILNRHNVVDIDQRGEEYREAGWTHFDERNEPYGATGTSYGAGSPLGEETAFAGTPDTEHERPADFERTTDTERPADYDRTIATERPVDYDASRETTDTAYADTTETRPRADYDRTDLEQGEEATVPVVEEEVRVGKREVEGGGARLTTHVEETPVEEQVPLRDETVQVERRSVDRPASEADTTAFQEGTFEVREHHEEPVVEKQARVVEEVGIRRDVDERTETVQDTVRRTDVDVEDASSQPTAGGYREVGTTPPESTTAQREPGLTDRIEDATGLDIDRDQDVAGRDKRDNY